MNNSFLVWFLVAVVLSWAMGAYNRLVRLRAKGLLAFSDLEQTLDQQMTLLSTNFLEAAVVVNEIPWDWDSFFASIRAVKAALKTAHLQPLNGEATCGLKDGIETVGFYWRQLVDLKPDLAGSLLPTSLQLQWELLAFQVERARAEFNQSVTNYNEAKNEFPANLLARIFDFKAAQPV